MGLKFNRLWYYIPLTCKVLCFGYFGFIVLLQFTSGLLSKVFIDENEKGHNDNTLAGFWILSILYWMILVTGILVYCHEVKKKILGECFDELITQYFQIRPVRSKSPLERRKRWSLLTNNMNEFVHNSLRVYNRDVMMSFEFSESEIEAYVNQLIAQLSIGIEARLLSFFGIQVNSLREQVVQKLKETHEGDAMLAYEDIIQNSESLFNDSLSTTSKV